VPFPYVVTIDDIAVAVSTVLKANSGFTTAVPGKAWLDRAPDSVPGYPYAVYAITAKDEADHSSDGTYTQTLTLRLGVYTKQGSGTPNAAQIAVSSCLNGNPTGLLSLREGSGKVLHVLPAMWDGKFDPKLVQGADIFVARGQWEILIEGILP
jgi:hypothetical protein